MGQDDAQDRDLPLLRREDLAATANRNELIADEIHLGGRPAAPPPEGWKQRLKWLLFPSRGA